MSERRHAVGAGETEILRTAATLGWRLLNIVPAPRRLVFGGPEWQAVFVVGSHVELSAHAPDELARSLGQHVELGEPEPLTTPAMGPDKEPTRPRLADTVEARAHRLNGQTRVLLHDRRSDAHRWVDEATWSTLRVADGSRDRDALRLAAGGLAGLAELADAGMLADGMPAPAPASPVTEAAPDRARPLETLPGFTLRCDGSGGCCRAYGAVPFSLAEAERARSLEGAPERLLFTPFRGSGAGPRAALQVDDACAFLDARERCQIHARAGAAAKPRACRLYPATLVDDGAALRVSVTPECACVFESVATTDGDPILAEADVTAARALARVLPDPVPLSAGRAAPRAEYRRWSNALFAHLADAPGDLAAFALGLADAIASDGLEHPTWADIATPRAPLPTALADRLRAHLEHPARSRASRDVAAWAIDAIETVDVWPEPAAPEPERLYLRALTFGHRLATEGRPLAAGLRERALRMLVARAMRQVPTRGARSVAHPLAALEAAMRHLSVRATG